MLSAFISGEVFIEFNDAWRYRIYESDEGMFRIEYQEWNKEVSKWECPNGSLPTEMMIDTIPALCEALTKFKQLCVFAEIPIKP